MLGRDCIITWISLVRLIFTFPFYFCMPSLLSESLKQAKVGLKMTNF